MRQFEIGDSAFFSKTISEADIVNYAGITGDFNGIHISENEWRKSKFGKRVAHGMLSAGFISTVLGTKLPGPGTIYLEQNIKFVAPVFVGDTITAKVIVEEIINCEKGIYRLRTVCENQNGIHVIEGSAVVKYSEEQIIEKNMNALSLCDGFYDEDEIKQLGLKSVGSNVKISRNVKIYTPELVEIGNNVRIDDFTILSGKIIIENYVHIAQYCGLYGGTEGIYLHNFSGLSSKVSIYATSSDYSGESMTNPTIPEEYAYSDRNAKVILEKHVIVGCGSVVLPDTVIGEGTSVGAMSMVGKSLEPWGIYVGCPAKRIKERKKTLLECEKKLIEKYGYDGLEITEPEFTLPNN